MIDMKVHRPTELHDMFHAAIENFEPYIAARPVEQVETDAAHAAFMQFLQFTLRRTVVDARRRRGSARLNWRWHPALPRYRVRARWAERPRPRSMPITSVIFK